MNELIKIEQKKIGDGEVNTVNARELHEFLEIGKDFSTWIKDRIKQGEFIQDIDFIKFPEIGGNQNRPLIQYFISLRMAKHLCMIERNEKGKQARDYFIECERKLKENKLPIMTELQMISKIALHLDGLTNRVQRLEQIQEKKADLTKLLPEPKKETLRMNLNKIVRSYSIKNNWDTSGVWNKLYQEFYYRYNVNLKVRARNCGMSKLDYAEKHGHMEDLLSLALELFA